MQIGHFPPKSHTFHWILPYPNYWRTQAPCIPKPLYVNKKHHRFFLIITFPNTFVLIFSPFVLHQTIFLKHRTHQNYRWSHKDIQERVRTPFQAAIYYCQAKPYSPSTDFARMITLRRKPHIVHYFLDSLLLPKNILSSFTTSCLSNLPLTKTNEVVTIYQASLYNCSL